MIEEKAAQLAEDGKTVVRVLTGSAVLIRMPTAWATTFSSAAQAVFDVSLVQN